MSGNNKKKETVAERLARMQNEKAEAAAKNGENDVPGLVAHLTHETTGEPDFAEIARQLEERRSQEPQEENMEVVKMTTYIRKDLYDGYMAICTRHGDKKNYMNEAIADLLLKKSRELGIK